MVVCTSYVLIIFIWRLSARSSHLLRCPLPSSAVFSFRRSSRCRFCMTSPADSAASPSAMPSVASSDGPGGASFAECFNPPSDTEGAPAVKVSSHPATTVQLASPSTPSASSSVVTKDGPGDAAVVSPSSAASAQGSPPALASPPDLKSASTAPSAAASIKRLLSDSNEKVTPSKSSKKAKSLIELGDLHLDSADAIERSYREIFGALSNLPMETSAQLNEILHRYTVETVKDWALSATGEAWPKKKKKKEAYEHVSTLVASRLGCTKSTSLQPKPPALDGVQKKVASTAVPPGVAIATASPVDAVPASSPGADLPNVKGAVPAVVADPSSLKQVG